MHFLYRSFSVKEPYNQWLFCEKRPATGGILWGFATLYRWHVWHNQELQVIFAKEPLIIELFCGKWPMKIRHPMGLRHPDYLTIVSWLRDMCPLTCVSWYGVATIGRILNIMGLFCKRALQKRLYSAKETYDFQEPTNRSHPICVAWHVSLDGVTCVLAIKSCSSMLQRKAVQIASMGWLRLVDFLKL